MLGFYTFCMYQYVKFSVHVLVHEYTCGVTKTPCNNKYQARDRYLEGADEILDRVLSFQNQANDTARSYPYALLHFLRPIQIHATDVLAVRREQLKEAVSLAWF